MKKNVSIDIVSKQYKMNGDLFASPDGEEQEEKIEISTDGVLSLEKGRFSISYDETELTGMNGAQTVLEFDEACPEVVTMTRSGTVSTSMIFKENSRYMSTYETGIMPLEMCIDTKSVENSLDTDGGEIIIDYTMEIHGICMERTYLTVTVKCNKNTVNKLRGN